MIVIHSERLLKRIHLIFKGRRNAMQDDHITQQQFQALDSKVQNLDGRVQMLTQITLGGLFANISVLIAFVAIALSKLL